MNTTFLYICIYYWKPFVFPEQWFQVKHVDLDLSLPCKATAFWTMSWGKKIIVLSSLKRQKYGNWIGRRGRTRKRITGVMVHRLINHGWWQSVLQEGCTAPWDTMSKLCVEEFSQTGLTCLAYSCSWGQMQAGWQVNSRLLNSTSLLGERQMQQGLQIQTSYCLRNTRDGL